jgi:cell division protein FtsI (penicillin-binding protein 3)
MDPRSGEILAMANYPTFNPNAYRDADTDARRNRAVQDLYEPGSTFKIITASAALDEKVVRPDDAIDVSAGMIRFGRSRVIRDDHRYNVLTFRGVLAKSSNVGAIKVGLRLGARRFGSYVSKFGFGRRLSPDFPGENAGIVWDPSKLNDSALASMLIGYQVGVTPLQMATAVSAVANGGELIQPRVVRAVIRGEQRLRVPRKVLGRPISESTAATLRVLLEAVTDEGGTATKAQIPGFTVAGKTGTAAKLVDGRYSTSQYNASFVGFVPSQQPVYTIVVVIDTPRVGSYYGGIVAAPIFQRIGEAALRYAGVPPTINPAPPVLLARNTEGHEQRTSGPVGLPPVAVNDAALRSASTYPDLRGLGARDALRALARLGVNARLHGAGIVVAQQPEAGTPVERGSSGTLWLERVVSAPPPSDTQQ